ncbi:hypothetical protein RR48_09858 [Papilio machaon]|uniref:Uncharacterized protein n=1 Tax=Papilio machaon TaxID=76193 RepID=A0A194R7S3_PAPMA|nr:hypothetical protein RR48_09858 [Papilio machaon]
MHGAGLSFVINGRFQRSGTRRSKYYSFTQTLTSKWQSGLSERGDPGPGRWRRRGVGVRGARRAAAAAPCRRGRPHRRPPPAGA